MAHIHPGWLTAVHVLRQPKALVDRHVDADLALGGGRRDGDGQRRVKPGRVSRRQRRRQLPPQLPRCAPAQAARRSFRARQPPAAAATAHHVHARGDADGPQQCHKQRGLGDAEALPQREHLARLEHICGGEGGGCVREGRAGWAAAKGAPGAAPTGRLCHAARGRALEQRSPSAAAATRLALGQAPQSPSPCACKPPRRFDSPAPMPPAAQAAPTPGPSPPLPPAAAAAPNLEWKPYLMASRTKK
jgi:hypothetical protein